MLTALIHKHEQFIMHHRRKNNTPLRDAARPARNVLRTHGHQHFLKFLGLLGSIVGTVASDETVEFLVVIIFNDSRCRRQRVFLAHQVHTATLAPLLIAITCSGIILLNSFGILFRAGSITFGFFGVMDHVIRKFLYLRIPATVTQIKKV